MLGAIWEQPGRRLASWALQWLRAWTLRGGGEVTEGFEGKSQLGLCVEWVGGGADPRGGCLHVVLPQALSETPVQASLTPVASHYFSWNKRWKVRICYLEFS